MGFCVEENPRQRDHVYKTSSQRLCLESAKKASGIVKPHTPSIGSVTFRYFPSFPGFLGDFVTAAPRCHLSRKLFNLHPRGDVQPSFIIFQSWLSDCRCKLFGSGEIGRGKGRDGRFFRLDHPRSRPGWLS